MVYDAWQTIWHGPKHGLGVEIVVRRLCIEQYASWSKWWSFIRIVWYVGHPSTRSRFSRGFIKGKARSYCYETAFVVILFMKSQGQPKGVYQHMWSLQEVVDRRGETKKRWWCRERIHRNYKCIATGSHNEYDIMKINYGNSLDHDSLVLRVRRAFKANSPLSHSSRKFS